MSDNNSTARNARETSLGSGGESITSDIGLLTALLAASARNDESEPGNGRQRISISIQQLLGYIARNGTGDAVHQGGIGIDSYSEDDFDHDEDEYDDPEDEEEEEDPVQRIWGQRLFNSVSQYFPRVTTPQEAGLKLLYSGDFGPPPAGPVANIEKPIQKPLSRRAARRAQRSPVPPSSETMENPMYPAHDTTYHVPQPNKRTPFTSHYYRTEAARGLVPNSPGAVVAQYEDKAYSGQFSLDASVFYSCTQGHDIWVYDANSSGEKRTDYATGHRSRMKLLNRVKGVYGNWTVTDSHLSPDNERIIYSSISPVAHITKLHEPEAPHISLDFSGNRRGGRGYYYSDDQHFGIWTCRFSADGKEVIACGANKIFVWDLNTHRQTINILAHRDDVNSCCWADTASGNVLISGSDDSMVKVWDRRSLSSNRPSGVLPGHTEGITSVSAKGDGRYIISNGKDHALRLWDLRMMRQDEEVDTRRTYGQPGYDYRYGNYRRPKRHSHPDDCSVMTFRGHAVFRTLIRCHFSPAETTGQAYVYSGSTDGRVYIWSLDGRIVQAIDRTHTLPITFEPSEADQPPRDQRRHRHNDRIIRDCSWHPHEPVMLSCLWHSDESSSIGRHEWKSLGKRGMTLEDVVEQGNLEANERGHENLFGF